MLKGLAELTACRGLRDVATLSSVIPQSEHHSCRDMSRVLDRLPRARSSTGEDSRVRLTEDRWENHSWCPGQRPGSCERESSISRYGFLGSEPRILRNAPDGMGDDGYGLLTKGEMILEVCQCQPDSRKGAQPEWEGWGRHQHPGRCQPPTLQEQSQPS